MERAGPRGQAHTLALHPATFPGLLHQVHLGFSKGIDAVSLSPASQISGSNICTVLSVRAVSKAPEVSIITFAHLFKLLFLAKALVALVP